MAEKRRCRSKRVMEIGRCVEHIVALDDFMLELRVLYSFKSNVCDDSYNQTSGFRNIYRKHTSFSKSYMIARGLICIQFDFSPSTSGYVPQLVNLGVGVVYHMIIPRLRVQRNRSHPGVNETLFSGSQSAAGPAKLWPAVTPQPFHIR